MASAMSYSEAAFQGGSNYEPSKAQSPPGANGPQPAQGSDGHHPPGRTKRSPSPDHTPVTEREEESVYVLALLTDQPHYKRMTAIRERYFPKHLNKLGAHLTLFHALPGSRMEDHILPTIQDIVSKTATFKVHAVKPFRLRRGIAVSVSKNHGSMQAQDIHGALQRPWLDAGFLSEQDRGGSRIHYTVMNKEEDELRVDNALKELQADFDGDWGVAEGLGLWRYDRGHWRWERRFNFQNNG